MTVSRVPMATLCVKCDEMDFFAQKLSIQDSFEELSRQASLCDFCNMRWQAIQSSFCGQGLRILFELVGSDLQLNHQYPPVISLLACEQDSGSFLCPCDTWTYVSTHIQEILVSTSTILPIHGLRSVFLDYRQSAAKRIARYFGIG